MNFVGFGRVIKLAFVLFFSSQVFASHWSVVRKCPRPAVIKVDTVYGSFDVEEPVLKDLFFCDALERLKKVHQYGFVQFLRPWVKKYTRYSHSVGVWALLRKFNAPIEEQIAGLLHDTSHTAFSHVAEYVYGQSSPGTAFQDDIHDRFLENTGIAQTLNQYGYPLSIASEKGFMLEQPSPAVCADRLEYTLQAGLLEVSPTTGKPLLDEADVDHILSSLDYSQSDKVWFFIDSKLAAKFAYVSLYTTENVVGAAWNHIIYSWMADAVSQALAIGVFTDFDFQRRGDAWIWERLNKSKDPIIVDAMYKIFNFRNLFKLCRDDESCDDVVHTKFRGINPLVKVDGVYYQLTKIDQAFAREYFRVMDVIAKGWRVKFIGPLEGTCQQISHVIS